MLLSGIELKKADLANYKCLDIIDFEPIDDRLELNISGVSERPEIGFLSGELPKEVGELLKNPIEPFWIIHFSNHYSVLYSAAEDNQEVSGETRNDFYWFPGFGSPRYVRFEVNTIVTLNINESSIIGNYAEIF